MGFLNCPKCGSINRDSDPVCFQCQADLTSVPPPPPPPPPPVENPVGDDPYAANRDIRATPLPKGDADKGRFKDLSERYVSKKVPKTDATILHGWRSGGLAGLVCGMGMAIFRDRVPDETTKLILKYKPKFHAHGSDIIVASFTIDFLFGLLIGSILAVMGQLCFPAEGSKTGAALGALIAAMLVLATGNNYVNIAIGALHGYILALLAGVIENKLFRSN